MESTKKEKLYHTRKLLQLLSISADHPCPPDESDELLDKGKELENQFSKVNLEKKTKEKTS